MIILVAFFLILGSIQSEAPSVKIKNFGSYWKHGQVGGVLWHNILVPQNIKKDELIAVAQALFMDRPGCYRFFTDDKEFKSFIDSDLHYLQSDKSNYPYPEKWANKHYIAMINKHPARGYLGEWALSAQSIVSPKLAESPESTLIISLGKPDKPIE